MNRYKRNGSYTMARLAAAIGGAICACGALRAARQGDTYGAFIVGTLAVVCVLTAVDGL